MELTQRTLDYIKLSNISQCINSNFLIADLKQVIYTENYDSKFSYQYKYLSDNITSLIDMWNILPISEQVSLVENNPTIQIVNNDTEKHAAMMIFPIYINKQIEGVIICFREKGNYIKSSSKAPNTIRKWIMKFMGSDIFPIY